MGQFEGASGKTGRLLQARSRRLAYFKFIEKRKKPLSHFNYVNTYAVWVKTGQEERAAQALRDAHIPGVEKVFVSRQDIVVYGENSRTVEQRAYPLKGYIFVRCVMDGNTWHAIRAVLKLRMLLLRILTDAPVTPEEEERMVAPLAAVAWETVERIAESEPSYLVALFRKVLAEKAVQIKHNKRIFFGMLEEVLEDAWWGQMVPLPLRL